MGRLRRLAEELDESGLVVDSSVVGQILLEEIDRALRPPVHERRVVSGGTFEPATDPCSGLGNTARHHPREAWRPTTAGRSSLCGRALELGLAACAQSNEWVVFDRPAGSERDLVVMSNVFDATIVQRHPLGTVRVVGPTGVFRWEGIGWHHEPPVVKWLSALNADAVEGDAAALRARLVFAVHDLGSLGIGALLVYRPRPEPGPPVEERLPEPPPLQIREASNLAPCAMLWPRSTGRQSSTVRGCSGSSVCG